MMKRLVAAALAAALVPQTANAALIGLYQFNDAGNLGLDSSGNSNHATNSGATYNATGFQDGAVRLNGSSWLRSPIDVSTAALPQLTWGAWVRPTTAAAFQTVLSADNGNYDRQLSIDPRGGPVAWSAFTGTGVLNSATPASTGDWTFLAAVYDQAASQLTFYVNGAVFSAATNFGASHGFFDIGHNPSYGEFFSGLIDNVFVYDEALSAAQISDIRANGFPSAPAEVPAPGMFGLLSMAVLGMAGLRRRKA